MGQDKFLTREKLFGLHRHEHFKWVIIALALIFIADIIFLNYKVFQPKADGPLAQSQSTTKDAAVRVGSEKEGQENIDSSQSVAKEEDECGEACIDQINKIVSSKLSSQDKSSSSTPSSPTSVKEFFIPFGSGVNSTDEWQDVPGIQAYIDSNAYGKIKKVTFEASIHVPSGNQTAEVRLYDVTAGHLVFFSEMVFTGGGTPQLLTSEPITLGQGSHLYKVQMKTQLKYPAYLDQARVHITTF